ncbi:unnamed protein product [Lactuca saligna]|uniref:Uncharacterized protein n=1 Tax=Lactuca saligna TaxID=75948 RepID=A0AA35Z800_LACSI|nr:unnamed protein product [Lactuca saligna]
MNNFKLHHIFNNQVLRDPVLDYIYPYPGLSPINYTDGWSVIQVNTKGAFPWKPDWHTSHITKDVVLGDYALMEMIYWCTGNDGINILHVKSIKKILNIAFSLPGISSSSFDASTSILLLPFSQTNYVKKVWISSHSFWW